jgi:nucleotide-binding universal stress UspA family protein
MGVIVVGVDQSEGTKAALRFALEEAKLRRATLRAVHAADELEATVSDAIPDRSEVEIERRVVEGTPGAVLVDEARGADLLVVGSRGRDGFAGLLLGSVSQQVAHDAACPVVIAHGKPKQ